MKIQCFVFNYNHFDEAMNLFNAFTDEGLDTYLLNCESKKDPEFEATDKIIKMPNVYYSGQWNEALRRFDGDVIFITNADVKIPDVRLLIARMKRFYEKYGDAAGIYAPNHFWTPWTYDVNLLKDVGDNLKIVPTPDSTIWSASAAAVNQVGKINWHVNKYGWGIEIVCAYYCTLMGKLVVRDYGIKCHHPCSTSYNRFAADNEFKKMITTMKLGNGFWDYYNTRNNCGFGYMDLGEQEELRKILKN